MQEQRIVYLHIPHTAGRSIRARLQRDPPKRQIDVVHNDQDIKKLKRSNRWNNAIKYFVLRPTVDRMIGEFLHYSMIQRGTLNHLNMESIKRRHPNWDPTDPIQFIELEENRNQCCKFILGKTDFTQPITPRDFENLQIEILNLKWDTFDKPINVPQLEKLLDWKPQPTPTFQSRMVNPQHNTMLQNQEIVNHIEKNNTYDIQLEQLLMSIADTS